MKSQHLHFVFPKIPIAFHPSLVPSLESHIPGPPPGKVTRSPRVWPLWASWEPVAFPGARAAPAPLCAAGTRWQVRLDRAVDAAFLSSSSPRELGAFRSCHLEKDITELEKLQSPAASLIKGKAVLPSEDRRKRLQLSSPERQRLAGI